MKKKVENGPNKYFDQKVDQNTHQISERNNECVQFNMQYVMYGIQTCLFFPLFVI